MKRWFALAPFLGLLALAAPLPQVYDRLEEALRQVRLENPTQALSALDRAQSLLRQESDGLPPVLRDATLLHLQDARQAVLRQSRVDLEARLLLVRHLLGKALYDGFFQAPPGQKALYLTRLVRATGLSQPVAQGAESLAPEEARRRLEAGYLQLMAEDLGQALSAGSRPQAYLALARAYARFLVIQDSPQSTLKAQDFIQAIGQVSGGEDFRSSVRGLQERALAWRRHLQTQAAPSPSATPPPSPAPAQSSPGPSAGKPSSTPSAASPPSPPIPSPSASPPISPAPQASPASSPSLDAVATVETFRTPPWMDPETARRFRQQAYDLGYNYNFELLDAVDQVLLEVGLAANALGRANPDLAREHLQRTLWRFQVQLEPLFSLINPELTQQVSSSLIHLSTATGLRTLDVFAVYEGLEELKRQFAQGPASTPWLSFKLWLTLSAGIPRAVLFLLAAALSLFPLYLIRLTFGGRNVYWNLLALAFLFLFLPIVVEGLSYFGAIMADYGGAPFLAFLSNLSIGQGLVPYLAWGSAIFLVVAFSAAGLRGIAAQFGLLRERGREVTATQDQRPSATTLTSETIVEWDEEF
ncbi:hypothetical protein [Thermus antranikianii]|uniref:Uncharacterized protein n=1 Tax=Thermus antranikianii TaxID=88190 RepID=A0ABY7RMT0_9DEIN|nr:hypothetical protein [Thermus antranikianii]WCM38758.1 hypothetical protein GO600_00755 [Thermus antranikianii]